MDSSSLNPAFKDLKQQAADTFDSSFDASAIADQFHESTQMVEQKVKEYAGVATDYIKQNPTYAILGAAGVGILLGAYLARRR